MSSDQQWWTPTEAIVERLRREVRERMAEAVRRGKGGGAPEGRPDAPEGAAGRRPDGRLAPVGGGGGGDAAPHGRGPTTVGAEAEAEARGAEPPKARRGGGHAARPPRRTRDTPRSGSEPAAADSTPPTLMFGSGGITPATARPATSVGPCEFIVALEGDAVERCGEPRRDRNSAYCAMHHRLCHAPTRRIATDAKAASYLTGQSRIVASRSEDHGDFHMAGKFGR